MGRRLLAGCCLSLCLATGCLAAGSLAQDTSEALTSSSATTSLATIAARLSGASLQDLGDIIEQLEQNVGEDAVPLLNLILNGDLYFRRADDRLVTIRELDNGDIALRDAFSGDELGVDGSRSVRKVRSNNSLRVKIRGVIARLTLFSKKPERRLAAVNEMLGGLSDEEVDLLRQAQAQEQDDAVLARIELALQVYQLQSEDAAQRLAAARALSGYLEPEIRNGLQRLLATDGDGNPLEADAAVREAAAASLAAAASRIEFFGFLETLFFGLSLGSVLLLAAAGLAITFGVMGVINMAHGELIMLGAYSTFVVQSLMPAHIGLSILISIPVAFLVSGLAGVLIERGVIRFLKGRPLETLLATFGISLILQQAVRTIFSPLNRSVVTPDLLSGSLIINPVFSLTYNRLFILAFALLVFALLQLIMKKTPLGLQVRAVSQNRDMARAMGIRTEWVDALTFGLGAGIAGIAGVALSLITNVGPNLGQSYIIDSFMVVVFGGVGNLWGTLVGGFSLGIANKFLEPVTGAVLANILVLIFIILFIQKRPRGLFPQKGRAAE